MDHLPTETYLDDSQQAVAPTPAALNPADTGILDLLLILARRKRLIAGLAAAGALIAAAIVFIVPPTFTATAVIMPPQQQQSQASALLGQLGAIASVAGRDMGMRTPADLYIGILSGRSVADALIAKFRLRELYDKRTLMDARKVLARRAHFSSGKDSLIKIAVDDHDPQRAAALANAYVDELYRQTSRLAITEAAQRRLFFERQLQAEKDQLADAESGLKKTQERTGVLQVSGQVEAVIGSMARLRAEIATREVTLYALRKAATGENPEVIRQEAEVTAMRDQLRKLEASSAKRPGDPLIPTSQVPTAGLEYARVLRNMKYHEALFELLAKQYEAARIDEAKEAPVIQIVDSAVPPEKKSWPPRALLTVAGALCGAILGCFLAFAGHRFREPAEAEKLLSLRRALFTFRNGRPSAPAA